MPFVQQKVEREGGQLHGGEIQNKACPSEASVSKPQEPGEKDPRSFRLLSFRKKKMPTRLEATIQPEKPLRRLSFKTVALSIQKWLIRVSVPKQNERTPPGLVRQEPPLKESTKDDKLEDKIVNVVVPRPNWNSVFSGIQNHGNTCFLNAIIQCLSHTDLLAKFFVLDTYKEDLHRNKSLNSARRSVVNHGEVTERLAVLIKSLWTSRYSAEISSGFKSVVGKHGEQYRGTLQHDAQEFLLWLLDAVHEDINRSEKTKVVKTSTPHPEKKIDYSAILNYLANNKSFILDIFQALLRSTLTCPSCGKQSITFDPYLSLSLPIPQRTTCPVWLTIIRPPTPRHNTRFAISIALRCHVSDLLEAVSRLMNVSVDSLLLTEIFPDGFRRTFSCNQSVMDIKNAQNLYVFELNGYNHFEKPTLLMQSLFPRLPTVVILMVNCEIQSNGRLKRFGAPFSVRVLKELNYLRLQEAIFKANPNIKPVEPDGNAFGLRVCTNGYSGNAGYLTPEVDHPLYQNVVEESLKYSAGRTGLPHVKMVAEWSKDAREKYFNFDPNEKLYEMHPSVGEVEKLYAKPWTATIDECLRLYTQEEQLSAEDAWLCPNCKHQQGAKKQLHLHTVPDILIIHLKRFKQMKTSRSKLHVMVNFPVEGLDMSAYMDIRRNFRDDPATIAELRSRDHIYDLYAVCNHLGSMCVGHYTASCKNPVDGHWYNYDDFRVDRIPEKDIITNSAYLLFYIRRSTCSTSSPMFSGSPASPEHWLFNVPKMSLDSLQVSNNASETDKAEKKEMQSEPPSLAEYYVSKKIQSDTHYASRAETSTCHVMSESCV